MARSYSEEHGQVDELKQERHGLLQVRDDYLGQLRFCRARLTESERINKNSKKENETLKKLIENTKNDKKPLNQSQ